MKPRRHGEPTGSMAVHGGWHSEGPGEPQGRVQSPGRALNQESPVALLSSGPYGDPRGGVRLGTVKACPVARFM